MIKNKIYCPVCMSKTFHEMLLESNTSTHSLYSCTKCKLKRLHPIPDEYIIEGMYKNQDQYDYKKAKYSLNSASFYLNQISTICRKNQQETLLDIGAGLGYYSNAFANKGISTTSVEPDSISSEFLQKNQNKMIAAKNMPIEVFLGEYIDEKYDIVFCRHVIEHINDHIGVFSNLKDVCHKNTVLIFETDNNESTELLEHPEVKKYWANYYLKNYNVSSIDEIKANNITALGINNTHYFAFNRYNLQMLFENLGFKTVLSYDYHLGDPYLWPNIPDYTNISSYFRIPSYILHIPQIIKYIKNKNRSGAGIISYLMLK